MPRARTHVIRSLVVMLVLAAPALAWAQVGPLATFGSPRLLSPPGRDAATARVGIDAAGNAVVMWTIFDGTNFRLQARARSAAGVLSAVQNVSPAGEDAGFSQIAVNGSGDAVFVWLRFDSPTWRLKLRARSAAGVLSAVQAVSPVGQQAGEPVVAIDSNGRALVVWRGHDGTNERIRTRARSAAGVLSAIQTLSAPGEHGWSPHVAIDVNGRAIVTWYRFDGSHYRVETRTRSAGGSLGPVETLSPAGAGAQNPRVAIAPDRTAVFAWTRGDGTSIRIETVARSVSGELSSVRTLSPAGQHAFRPRVAVDGAGNAVFTWNRSDGTDVRAQTRTRFAAGALSAVQTLSPAGADCTNPEVAVDAAGNAIFVWDRAVETIDGTTGRVQARVRAAAGTLGSVRTLDSSAEDGMGPVVAANSNGDAIVGWAVEDGSGSAVYAATATLP